MGGGVRLKARRLGESTLGVLVLLGRAASCGPGMRIRARAAQRTLLTKAKTWYVGANVKDKPQGLTLFTGGFAKYREYCAAAVNDGYKGFVFERAEEAVEA